MQSKLLLRAFAAVLALLGGPAVWAYVVQTDESGVYVIKWHSSSVGMEVKLPNTTNLIDGGSQLSAVIAAAEVWNAQLGTVRLSAHGSVPGAYAVGNQKSEIVMDSTVDGDAFPSGALAITVSYTRGNDMDESDIVFNTAYTWNSYRGALRRDTEDIRRVAVHELGHVLGLDHPDEHGQYVTALMNSHVSAIETLQPDDIEGVHWLYGAPNFVPPNNAFASARAIGLNVGSAQVSGSNIGADRERGEPEHGGSTGQGHSVWWKWSSPSNGEAEITTLGSNFDTVLGIYTGATVSALTEIASNDDAETPEQNPTAQRKRTSRVVFDAVAGATYFVAVDGWSSADRMPIGYSGSITLNLNFWAYVPPSFVRHPSSKSVQAGQFAEFSAFAEGQPSPAYRWQRLSSNSVWLDLPEGDQYTDTSTATLRVRTNFAMDGDQFRCVATNRSGAAVSNVAVLRVTPLPLPVITTPPVSSTFFTGYSGWIWVQATEATGYQWYRNDVLLPDQTDWGIFFSDPQPSDAGNYHVVVSNAGGSVKSATIAVSVAPIAPVASIQASEHAAMFLREDGSRWVMGFDQWSFGQNLASPRPLVRTGETGLIAAAVGSAHNLFVKGDRTLWAYGGNSHGQLGDGSTASRHLAAAHIASDVVSIAAGRYVSFFIKSDGTLWGMGQNEWGLLGTGTTADQATPVLVARSVRTVSVTYASVVFIKTDGSLWGLGSDYYGQLGDGATRTNRTVPIKIADDVVFANSAQFCTFFVKRDGTLWAVGGNSHGELGDGTTVDRSTPVPIMKDVVGAAGGYEHSLFLKKDGSLWATGWLHGQFDQVGARNTPIEVARGVVSMAAGVYCSYFLKSDGSLWATGENRYGQLGIGSISEYESTPQRVIGADPKAAPILTTQPQSKTGVAGDNLTLTVAASGTLTSALQWFRNGDVIANGTASVLAINSLQPEQTGLYSVVAKIGSASTESTPAIVGLSISQKVLGTGAELQPANIRHPNGNTFDQVALTGPAESIMADYALNQITRTSFIDLDGDIVQVEFSGPGTLSLVLDGFSAPAAPENYNQPGVQYVKGHAGIVIVGADERTNVSVFSVGRATAFDPTGVYDITKSISMTNDPAKNGSPLFQGHATTDYDGIADIAFIAILSTNGRFGGVRTANANYFASQGYTGVYAPGVEFTGPVYIGDVSAFDAAKPVIVLGAASDVRITGGDLLQNNRQPVQVSGITQLRFTEGSDSHGNSLRAQANQAVLQQDGVDVTKQLVSVP